MCFGPKLQNNLSLQRYGLLHVYKQNPGQGLIHLTKITPLRVIEICLEIILLPVTLKRNCVGSQLPKQKEMHLIYKQSLSELQ